MDEIPRVELLGESGADPIRVVPYDETWPAGFADWHARLSAVVPAATRIDHVGSTVVPGLPAKPTIDIQISVVAVEDEPRPTCQASNQRDCCYE